MMKSRKPSVVCSLLCASMMLAFSVVGTSCSSAARKKSAPREKDSLVEKVVDLDRLHHLDGLGIKLNLERRTLPNGLTILMVEDHTVPVISYQSWFKVGSVDEKPGYTGIAHLFEHLMFKGTKKYGPKEFLQQLEARGAAVNAYTTRDYTVYHETFTPNLLDRVIDMESDRLANLIINEEIFQTERQVVIEERRLRTDNSPSGKVQEALWALSYKVHPYQWPVIGYQEDLDRMSVQDLRNFFTTYYQPGNATLVIVGDFQIEPTFEKLKKAYGEISGKKRDVRQVKEEPEQKEERRRTIYDQVAGEKLAISYHASRAENDDSYSLDVLANILFAGTNSRAYRRLVEDRQLAVDVSGVAYTPTYPGLFMMSATMKSGLPTTQAESELESLIREIQENGVTDQEIEFAVRQLTVQVVDGVRTSSGLGTLIGTVQLIFGDPYRFANDLSKYLKVTSDEVRRVANQYLVPQNRSVVTLKPFPKRAAIEKGSR